MKNIKLVAAISMSFSLISCGTPVGPNWCEQKASCAEELGEQTTETVAECIEAYDASLAGFSADQIAITEAILNTCLAESNCEDFAECMDSLQ